ncbi:SDR family oxidoreductase [Sphingomonas floccifaciens]|uniref:SDR family oxidoreductase n=1 Tax=Sphingomonas floccifaciens TaxID=1844115 RepID=A0ABW4NEB2_9SPHN
MSRVRLKPIDGQVIVITGASSGIGLVTARLAIERGAKVMLVSRDAAALQSIVTALGENADFAAADVGDAGAVEAVAQATIDRFGRIDSWINVAGVAIYAKLLDTPMDEHERLFRTNYFGVVHSALAAIPRLRQTGGAFITVASIVSDLPAPVMGAYAASKHAVKGYIDSLRIEVTGDALPIAITLIKPSGTDTPIADHAANHLDGAALLPPPVYDPAVVAEAILDATVHPRREVTVGGIGRAQVLAATHFPQALDWMGGVFARLLRDPSRPPSSGDNLGAPVRNGRERSRDQTGRSFSLYTAAERNKGALAGGLLLAGVAIAAGRRLRASGK